MWGAGGAGGDVSNQNAKTHGGGGGFVEGELDVTPGEKLLIIVGEGGKYGNSNQNLVIYGGGGLGGYQGGYTGTGGGRSEIRRGNTVIATAGAGGGGGESRGNSGQDSLKLGGVGGAGGGIKGRHGSRGQGYLTKPVTQGGKGGTQNTGGAGGIGNNPNNSQHHGFPGAQFQGGLGSNGSNIEGGGGGGGYFGGGGGAGKSHTFSLGAGGGGGGSSYIGGLTNASTIAGGDGDLPGNSQQKAAQENHQYNQKNYGRGGDVSSDGQNGFIVIKVIEKEYPSGNITTADFTACHGSTVEVSGNVDVDGPWTLTLSDNSVINGNGPGTWSKNVSPSSTEVFSIFELTNNVTGSCPSALSGSTKVTLPATNNEIADNGKFAECYVKGNNYIHFYHSSGSLIGSINPEGQDLGLVKMIMYEEPAPLFVPACVSPNPTWGNTVMNRHWVVVESNPSQNNVNVRLPFYDVDFNKLTDEANNNLNTNDDITNVSDVRLSKYNGLNENDDAADNCGNGTTVVYTQTSNGDITLSNSFVKEVNNGKYVQFTIPGFSELWLHGSTDSPLPVELINFSASCEEQVEINWTTASESNSDQFIVEKSRDGINWNFVESLSAAGNSVNEIDYKLTDRNISNGIHYYRLRQIDFDGKEEVFGPISVSCSPKSNSMIVYPNPTEGKITVKIQSQQAISNAEIILLDFNGRIIAKQVLDILKGENEVYFNETGLSKGVYLVQSIGINGVTPVKVIKK
ncbi:hypothetical protein DIT68_12095 [Brumimicrobium oceani]|uniref:receptor protein-tyrosine kinase n=2 Tax=Brumimicrobium oceani TaxID=2100725 RepID=A0A2U2XAP8_9FLAO|nr:hypothetical protein DIT68_12095 [Brumimicrobium oceani]